MLQRMDEILPAEVLGELQRSYLEAIRRAELSYAHQVPDTDILTGAMAAEFERSGVDVDAGDGRLYQLTFDYRSAAEDRGAPGIFYVEVADLSGKIVFRKSLLFHATVQWKGRDQELVDRARGVDGNFRRAVVIDYSSRGYYAASIAHVLAANGDRRRMRHRMRKLDEVLGIDFVHCRMGLAGVDCSDLRLRHVLSTRIRRVL
jgi:hypothetical protein